MSNAERTFLLFLKDIHSGNLEQCGEFSSHDDASKGMSQWLSDHGLNPIYYRFWVEDNKTFIDYGSHSKWFVIEDRT